jgi:hypothetical protein
MSRVRCGSAFRELDGAGAWQRSPAGLVVAELSLQIGVASSFVSPKPNIGNQPAILAVQGSSTCSGAGRRIGVVLSENDGVIFEGPIRFEKGEDVLVFSEQVNIKVPFDLMGWGCIRTAALP